ncbi:hypothetical protein LXA43DRAFT_606830 [Ganoderma leucocontextum]|nr:hypothetical protein LXA43DRAFT_606830 [Ganoderma leucocontextum]
MAEPHFTLERALERFGTREALIDFILDVEDVDKKKLMNIWVCFRMVYNELLPESPSRRQDAVSKEAGKAWKGQKRQNPDFWKYLVLDVYAEHKARFPEYWRARRYIKSLPTAAQRKAATAALPKPRKRVRKKRGDVERKKTSRPRLAPHIVQVRGSSSSSRSRSSRSSSESRSPSTTSQASSSAAALLSTPSPLPVYPSAQPSPMVPLEGHVGWQASEVAPPISSSGNRALNGGQSMVAVQPAPVVAFAPLDMQMQVHSGWTGAAEVPAGYDHQPSAVTTASLLPQSEISFPGYGTYQVDVTDDALFPAQAVPSPSHQWESDASVDGFAPIPSRADFVQGSEHSGFGVGQFMEGWQTDGGVMAGLNWSTPMNQSYIPNLYGLF